MLSKPWRSCQGHSGRVRDISRIGYRTLLNTQAAALINTTVPLLSGRCQNGERARDGEATGRTHRESKPEQDCPAPDGRECDRRHQEQVRKQKRPVSDETKARVKASTASEAEERRWLLYGPYFSLQGRKKITHNFGVHTNIKSWRKVSTLRFDL